MYGIIVCLLLFWQFVSSLLMYCLVYWQIPTTIANSFCSFKTVVKIRFKLSNLLFVEINFDYYHFIQ